MSPTLADDDVVRVLNDRAEREVPPMTLDPGTVLSDARRYRRRRTTTISAAGVMGIAVIAFGAVHLAGVRDDVGPAPAAHLVDVGDFTVVAATDAVPVDEDTELRTGTLDSPGTLFDTGVPVDPDEPSGATWVLENVVLDPEDVADLDLTLLDEEGNVLEPGEADGEPITNFFAARSYDPDSGELGERIPGGSTSRGDGLAEPEVDAMGMQHDDTLIAFGLTGQGYRAQVYLTGARVPDASAEESRVLLPTFTIPGVDGYVYFLRVAGAQPWPHVTVHPSANTSLQLNWNPDGDPWGR